MAPNTSFPNTDKYSLATSNVPTQIAGTQSYELEDILAQLFEQDNQDDAQIRIASDSSFVDDSACGIVDSLTLVNCRHLIPEMFDARDLAIGFQEQSSSVCFASNGSMTSKSLGHRRSGLRRVSIEDTENDICTYIVQTKKE